MDRINKSTYKVTENINFDKYSAPWCASCMRIKQPSKKLVEEEGWKYLDEHLVTKSKFKEQFSLIPFFLFVNANTGEILQMKQTSNEEELIAFVKDFKTCI